MWSGGTSNDGGDDDVNDNGERVRLYQPILYGRKPTMSNLSSSFIGGQSLTAANSSNSSTRCPNCQEPVKQLVQLFIPKSNNNNNNKSSSDHSPNNVDRTLIVWACNRASCVAGLFTNNNNNKDGFAKGGGNGVIVCKRYMVENKVLSNNIEQDESKKVTTTASNDIDDVAMMPPGEENDWTVHDDMQGDNNDLDDLEAKLASMESNPNNNKPSSGTGKKKSNPKSETSSARGRCRDRETAVIAGTSFPCFELHSVQEPLAPRRSTIMDEDDVGISASGASNDKIQQMLARYMQEEDDEDILIMLRNAGGSSGSGSNSAANIAESDPGVSPQDRALLRYSDRLQRSPRQVLRYAYNGQPLWSIPLPSCNKNVKGTRKQQGKYTRNDCDNNDNDDDVLQVPACSNCGAPRVFEVQILPSILHVLDVDRYAPTAADAASIAAAVDQGNVAADQQHVNNNKAYNNIYCGGMDFGNIAIYTCSAACRDGQEEYVVVQDSVDKQHQFPPGQYQQQQQQQERGRNMYSKNEVVVIPEDSKFDDNDEA